MHREDYGDDKNQTAEGIPAIQSMACLFHLLSGQMLLEPGQPSNPASNGPPPVSGPDWGGGRGLEGKYRN